MRKALFLAGGWSGHEPFPCAKLFADWLEGLGFSVRVADSLDVLLEPAALDGLDLVVPVWTMGEISPEQSKALREAVKNGVNLAGWHGGMCDSFRQDTEYQFMTGGQWVVHPGGVVKYRVNVRQDPEGFMAGLSDFDLESEQYYMHVDPSNTVLATTTFTGEYGDSPWIAGTVMPVAWKRRYGKARVFYSSLGHVARDFAVSEVTEIMRRGIAWAAGFSWPQA